MREKDAEWIELSPLNATANRRILLHQFARFFLALGGEDDETEWPVEAPTGEPHATLGIPRLKPPSVLLNYASLLLTCARKETPVKRGPNEICELHALSL